VTRKSGASNVVKGNRVRFRTPRDGSPCTQILFNPSFFSPETRRRVFVVNPFPCGPGSSQFVTRHTWASYVVRALSPSHQRDKVQDSGGEGAVKGLGRSEMKFEVEVKLGAGGMGNPGREDGSWGCLFFCSCTGLSVLCGLFCSCS
jgi:hypothetical protein